MSYTNGLDNPHLYFQCKLYTGNSTDDTSITLDGDENMSPNLVWLKRRDAAGRNRLFDTVRGATKSMRSDDGESEITAADSLKSFDSDGFTLGADSASGGINVNINNETMVAWCFKESATAGFDIVGYSGNETNRTISHSLSAAPHLMIIKNRDSSFQWVVYHHKNTSAPETDYLYLSSNAATADFAGHFNDTAPTSSVFTVGTDTGVNKNSQNHIAYLWSEKQGFSKFSSFRGNSNSDGVFVMCGFRPSMVWIKRTEGSNHWFIWDKHRDGFNESNEYLKADASEAESDGVNRINILSNGFKITTSNDGVNAEEEYIFMAWADAPFVNSNGVPCNAR